MFIKDFCCNAGELVTGAIEGALKGIYLKIHDHKYESITSIYYRETKDIRYHDKICRCKICGKKKTFREEVNRKDYLYVVTYKHGDDAYRRYVLIVGKSPYEVRRRVLEYIFKHNADIDLSESVEVNQIDEDINGIKITVGNTLVEKS